MTTHVSNGLHAAGLKTLSGSVQSDFFHYGMVLEESFSGLPCTNSSQPGQKPPPGSPEAFKKNPYPARRGDGDRRDGKLEKTIFKQKSTTKDFRPAAVDLIEELKYCLRTIPVS